MIYKLCSFAMSTICLRELSSNIKPVGLLGLIRHIATVFAVIFDRISSISAWASCKLTANSIGLPPCNLTYDAYGG